MEKDKITVLHLILIFISVVLILFHVITLKDGHNWGDDFAQYIICAKNIAFGEPYQTGIMLDLPVVYPSGYPIILSPLIKGFGVNFKVLKSLNILFWYLTILLYYPIITRRLNIRAGFFISFLFIASSDFFTAKQNVISDLAFLCFCSLAIYFFSFFVENKQFYKRLQEQLVLVLCLLIFSFTFLIRSVGATLFLTAIFYLGGIKKDWRQAGIFLLILLLVFFSQQYLIGANPGFFSQIFNSPLAFLKRSLLRSALPFRSIFWAILPGQTIFSEKIFLIADKILIFMSPIFYCLIIGAFLIKLKRKTLSFLDTFFLIYLFILVVWSGFPTEPPGFTRFILPILIPAFIYIFEILQYIDKILLQNVNELLQKSAALIIIILAWLNILNITTIYDFNDNVFNKKPNKDMLEWVKVNVKADEHYMIWRPRAVALMTGRVGTVPTIETPVSFEKMIDRINTYKIKYLILSKTADLNLIAIFEKNTAFSAPIWENDSYQIFKVLPNLVRSEPG